MAKAGLEFRRPPSPPSRELSHIYDEPPTFAGVVRTKHSQSAFEITPADQDAAAKTPLPISRQISMSSASSASSSSTTGRPEPSKPKKSSPKKGSRPGTPQRATRPAASAPSEGTGASSSRATAESEGSAKPPAKKELTPEEQVEAEELVKLEAFAKQHENMGDGSDGSSHDFRGVGVGALEAGRLTLQRRSSRSALAGTNLMWSSSGVGAKDEETAPLIALYYDHDGDLKSIFKELGESPRKALKHPPKDAQDFALKYISGKLSDYAAPKVDPGWEEQMMRPDKPRTHLQALASVFPGLPHEVLFAVLEAANGSLDGAVHLLLDSGAHLSDDYHPDDQQAPPVPPPPPPEAPPPPPAPLSELQRQRLERGAEADAEDDFVLAITVPQGSRPNALLKITTTAGTVHARVPPNVRPGQTFFIRMRRGGGASSSGN